MKEGGGGTEGGGRSGGTYQATINSMRHRPLSSIWLWVLSIVVPSLISAVVIATAAAVALAVVADEDEDEDDEEEDEEDATGFCATVRLRILRCLKTSSALRCF